MPTYNYKCKKCENVQEEFHPYQDEPWIKCNNCGSSTSRLFPAPTGFVKCKTLGSLADANTAKMSDDEIRQRTAENVTKKKGVKQDLGPGMERVEKTTHTPFLKKHHTKTTDEIRKMTVEQRRNYVKNG